MSLRAHSRGCDRPGYTTWVITEDEGNAPDQHTDMGAAGGRWHCLEVVVDAAGKVTGYIDDHPLIGPFARASAASYTNFTIGVGRTVVPNVDLFIDDVAMGPSRLNCP